MRSAASTVIVVVGDAAPDIVRRLDDLPNVRAVSLRDDAPDGPNPAPSGATYFVHDRDPLEHVAAAWVEFFTDQVTAETLDAEVDAALQLADTGRFVMPDYYLVLDPESLDPEWKHWWLGTLAAASPIRVIPTAPSFTSVRRQLARLPAGRAWPRMEDWLPGLKFAIPDRVSWQLPRITPIRSERPRH